MDELNSLILRKQQLLKHREVLKRKQQTEIRDESNSDVVEDSDTEIPAIISNSSLRIQRNVTVCSTDDEPSNDSINTSTVCLPLDHSFFQPYKSVGQGNNASINNNNSNDASSTTGEDITYHTLQNISVNLQTSYSPSKDISVSLTKEQQLIETYTDEELHSDDPRCISVEKQKPLELQVHNSTIDGVTKHVTNNSATSLPENHQMDVSITNEEFINDSAGSITRNVRWCTENKGLYNANKKINIISEIILIRPIEKNLVTDNAPHSFPDSEHVIDTGLQSCKAGSAQVNSTENFISETDLDALHQISDLESATETKLGASSVNDITNVMKSNDSDKPSRTNEVRTKYELPSCSFRQDDFNTLFEGNYSDQETNSLVNTSPIILSPSNNGRKKRKVTRFPKAYMDFKLEEDNGDFSSGSSDNWSPKETEYDSSSETKKKAKKRTKEVSNEEINHIPRKKTKIMNKTKTRKLAKEKGLSYETITGKMKEPRKLKNNPCVENKCPRKCYDISEERRQALFEFFWGLDDQRKKEWIVQCAKHISIKRKRTDSPASRRGKTYEYYINEGEGRRQVCQQFLRNTLDISQTYLLYNLSNSNEGISHVDKRTRHAANKYDENTYNHARKYIEDLPVLPSHYNRPKSSRLYISQDFKNVTNLHRLYVIYCSNQAIPHLSDRLFRNLLNEYNLSFHIPKKDKCKVCLKYENNTNVLNEKETNEYQNHLDEKRACYRRTEIHRNYIMLSNDNSTVMASFDLQKVLNTPHGQSMLLYYSRKYAVYNLTVYESNTQNGFCYTWGESDGKRGSCEIGTCLYKYLLEVDKNPNTKYVILYCDSCWGQNKNKVILSVLKYFLENAKNVQSVQVNYLLPGHTYMPVDSMHSVIEREVRKLIVWSPIQWPTFMLTARKQPRPYFVNTLDHTDFINWENLANEVFTSKTTSDPHFRLKDIRIATIKKTHLNELEVKYTMKDDGDTFKIILGQETKKKTEKGKGKGKGQSNARVVNDNPSNDSLPKLHVHRLPISTKKYMDLKKLCDDEVIPKQYVQDYLQLPYVDKIDYLDDIIQDEVPTNDNEIQDQSDEVHESEGRNAINKKQATQKERNRTNNKNGKTEDKAKAKSTVEKGKGKAKQGKAEDDEIQEQSDEVHESAGRNAINKKQAIQKGRNQTNKYNKNVKTEDKAKANSTVEKGRGKGKAKRGKAVKKSSN